MGAGTHPGPGVPGVIASAEILGKLIPDAEKQKHDGYGRKKTSEVI